MMNACIHRGTRREVGMVLITSLLLLLVVTILALAMFRGVGLEGRIAGNVMDKTRALQAATSTEDYAEQWLVNSVSTAAAGPCTATSFNGATTPVICTNTLVNSTTAASAATVPWVDTSTGKDLGYGYNPVNAGVSLFPISTTGGVGNYYQAPTVYIAQLGPDATYANGVDYQIDGWSFGGSTGSVAVVESIYQIRYLAQGTGP